MVCNLATPQWENPRRKGLQAAVEVPAENSIALSWGDAIPVAPGELVQYIIYYSEERSNLFLEPKAFSEGRTATIPVSLAADGYFFAVRASQMGIASISSDLSSIAINETAFSFPNITNLGAGYFNGSHVYVDSIDGFPLHDGYLEIEDEVIFYSNAIDGYTIDGYDGYAGAFEVSDRDPFGCNTIVNHAIDTVVRLFKGFEEANETGFQNEDICALQSPVWADIISPGIKSASDLGVGTSVRLRWDPATTPAGMSDTYYNVYCASSTDTLFDYPFGITQELTVIVPNLQPGDGYYFGVRATYFHQDISITGLETLSENFYKYPVVAYVDEFDGYYTIDESGPLLTTTTNTFASSGVLKVGSEFLEYSSSTISTFIISQRDVFNRGRQATHANGTEIRMFKGIEDSNSVWYRSTPTWEGNGISSPQLPSDGYSEANSMQDSDGYRVWKVDNLNENHELYEEGHADTLPQPSCGYRSTNYVALWTRNACGTYAGGRPDGFAGGININESNLQREEFLLAHSGEPVILLRQKTTGKQCPAYSLRGEHSAERCGLCFGTKIVGGYDKYFHTRRYQPDIENPTGLFNIRVGAYKNDLPLKADSGLSQVDELSIWLPGLPFIKKRDIIIRYIRDEFQTLIEEEFRYEVTSVTRGKIILGFDGKQNAEMRKLDKTHSIYQFPVALP